MADKNEITTDQTFTKTVSVDAPASAIWKAITDTELMIQWMSQPGIEIVTDWKAGGPIIIRGPIYKTQFENKGTVLIFEPERRLRYNHLSSLSRLPDVPENYSIMDFMLSPSDEHTLLTITLSNFPTETIYKHLAFYWNVTLELLKKFIENR